MQEKTNMLSDALGFLIDETYMHARTRPQALGGLRIEEMPSKNKFFGVCTSQFFEDYLNVKFKESEALWSRHIVGYDSTSAMKGFAFVLNHENAQTSYTLHTDRSKPTFGTKQIEQRCVLFFFVFSHVSHPR